MDPYKYEWAPQKPNNNVYMIDAKIEELGNLLNTIKTYHNPYEYIHYLDSDTESIEVVEITPDLFNRKDEFVSLSSSTRSNIKEAILNKYSDLESIKKFKLSEYIPIDMRLKLLYAERLAYQRKYYLTIFPPKYASIFKEHKYKNFYGLVEKELVNEIDSFVLQKIQLLGDHST